MDRLTALEVFVEVAERGSLTQAADRLNLSKTAVSRYLAGVEAWLGARLLHRTTRRVTLSDAGEEALARCRELLELSRQVESRASHRSSEARGTLRISASSSFAQAQLATALTEFRARNPGVRLEILALDRHVNLVEERVDLAVRITNALDQGVVARRLAVCRSVLCASRGYLQRRGRPVAAADLASHDVLVHDLVSRTGIRLRTNNAPVIAPVAGQISTNETGVLRATALAGGGIAMLPTYCVADDLRAGHLVRVLADHEPEAMGIHAVYLSRDYQPQALRLMIDFLAERFGGDRPPWDVNLDPLPVPETEGRRAARSARSGRRSRRASS